MFLPTGNQRVLVSALAGFSDVRPDLGLVAIKQGPMASAELPIGGSGHFLPSVSCPFYTRLAVSTFCGCVLVAIGCSCDSNRGSP